MHNVAYHRIERIAGSVITLRAEGVANQELAQVTSSFGTSLARVIRIDGDMVDLQVFAGARGISTDSEVRFLGEPMKVPYSEALLGRVFNGAGKPRDNGPEVDGERITIGGPSVNPAKRIIPKTMVRTGIPMIDVFNTLVVSQKLPIFSIAGEPYNELLARIALQAEVDVIILGGMGLKHDDYLYLKDFLEKNGALSRTVMFMHTASDPIVECLLVPDASLAVAEKFATEGKNVLVLLTDMTNFADAMKEIAITMEQIPSNRGYPGDLYSQLASRYEKAVDFEGSGSITILDATLKDMTDTVSVEGINAIMKAKANESFGYTEEELVSTDIIGMEYGSLFDATQTLAQQCGTHIFEVRIVAWYDNEMSYTCQLIRTLKYLKQFCD